MMKKIILLLLILLISCTKKDTQGSRHDISSSEDLYEKNNISESIPSSLKKIPDLNRDQLLDLAYELLGQDAVANKEITSTPEYREKLKILNGNFLRSTDKTKEYSTIFGIYKNNVLCGNYAPDCSGYKLLKAGNFTQEVLIKIIIDDIAANHLAPEDMINAFYLAYEIIKTKDKQILDQLFVSKYSIMRDSPELDSNMRSILDKHLGPIADRLGKSNPQGDDFSALIKSLQPWNYSNNSSESFKKIQKVLMVQWIKQKPTIQQYQEALEQDKLSIINQMEEISPLVLNNLQIDKITADKCYYLLDRYFGQHISGDVARLITSSMDNSEKKKCLPQQLNYLKARMLTTIKTSNKLLMEIIQKIKKENISNIKIFDVIESRLTVLKSFWQNELEKFKAIEELLHAEFTDASGDTYNRLKLSFESLKENFQMFAQYPATLSLLYHFKDMISSSVGMDLKIKETDISHLLENLLWSGQWQILDFGISSLDAEKTLNQTKIIHSFQSALLTDTFNDLKTPPENILEFIIDKLPTREFKYLNSELAALKNHEINSAYKTVAQFCEKHAQTFLSNDSSKYKYKQNLSDLSANLLFNANKSLFVDQAIMDRMPGLTEIARLDYERKNRFGRILVDIYNEFSKKQNHSIISNDLYNSWVKKHLDTQKNVIKTNMDYINKSYTCLNRLKNIQKYIVKKVFNYEYHFLKEVHKQMTLLRNGRIDNLQLANEITHLGLGNFSNFQDRYLNQHVFSYSKIAFWLRLKNYLTSHNSIGDLDLPPIAKKMSIIIDMDNIDEKDKIISRDIPYDKNVNIFIKRAMGNLYAEQIGAGFLNWWAYENTPYALAAKVNSYLQLYKTNIHGIDPLVDEKKIISEVLKNYKLIAIDEQKDAFGLSEKALFQNAGLTMSTKFQNPLDVSRGVNINHFIDSQGVMIHNIFNEPASYLFNFAMDDTLISQQDADEVQANDDRADLSNTLKKNYGNYEEGYNYFRDKNSMGPLIFDGFEVVANILDNEFIQLIKFDLDKIKNFHNAILDANIINPLLEKYHLNNQNILIKITEHEAFYVPKDLISDEISDRLTDHYLELLDNIQEVIKNQNLFSKI